ncbi:hypothetical protein [Neisseria sp. Marseille-Q6792]|uniref:hypothetical protein n=1 Tax=Neisseria sp. Marseille-Q6792 TaxID=2937985 RepID=UPI0020256144|nr:hypothetical protein [Neisseria sp. Marseille-Q6792]
MPSETIKQCFRRHQHLRGFAIFTKTANQNPVIPAQAGIQTGRHGNLSGKTVSLTLSPRFPLSWE